MWFCVPNHLWLSWSLCFISLFFVTIPLCHFCFLCFLFVLGFALHNIHASHTRLFLLFFSKKKKKNKNKNKNKNKTKKKKRKMEEKYILHYFSWIWNQGWPSYLYITCLCTLFSLDELIVLHFTSLSFVVHVVWELFIVFDHMILILKSHAFDCKD